MVTLIDSTLWVHQFRQRGDPGRRARVEALLRDGDAAWCPPVRLELWRGVSNEKERKALKEYEAVIPDFAITNDVWELAMRTAERGRGKGFTFPTGDLLIFACAKFHRLNLAHADKHFEQMEQL